MKKYYLFVSILMIVSVCQCGDLFAQDWLRNEVEEFKKEDAAKGTTSDGILFLGSSSFRMWDNIKDYFPGHPIVKRGFGGSSMRHAVIYFNDLVKPHKPSQIIAYFGDNDLSNNNGYTVDLFMKDVRCFVRMVQLTFPKTEICFVSIKPSPSRRAYFNQYIQANKQIREMCEAEGLRYIDVWGPMTGNDNRLKDPTTFTSDSLHMNVRGYTQWKEIITPYLRK